MSTKGLIWVHTNEHRKLIDISQLQQYELNGYSRGSNAKVKHSHKHSIATRVHLSNVLRGKTGGYHIGSGKGIKGYYKGIYCSSSWELAFVIYHIEHCLNIKQCTEVRTYEFNGKCHKYHPDFVTDVGIFEIKGIKLDDKTRAKLAANPDVILIDRNSIWDPYLSYVVNKYGWGFTNLYDTQSKTQIFRQQFKTLYWRAFVDYTKSRTILQSFVYVQKYNAIYDLASTKSFKFSKPTQSIVNAGISTCAHVKHFVQEYTPELSVQCKFIQRKYI